jgi:hypothetical protein
VANSTLRGCRLLGAGRGWNSAIRVISHFLKLLNGLETDNVKSSLIGKHGQAAILWSLLGLAGGMNSALADHQMIDPSVDSCVGRVCKIEGLVVDVLNFRKNVVLVIGDSYPGKRLKAIIDADSVPQFHNVKTFEGQKVRVTGLVKLSKGNPEMSLIHPSQLVSAE